MRKRQTIGVVALWCTVLVLVGMPLPAGAEPGAQSCGFNGDGYADLAVGVPFEAIGALSGAGAVSVLYGTGAGLTATGDQLWHQDQPGIQDASEMYDALGRALAAGDFNGDGRIDLAVGVPEEAIGTVEGAGAVNVLYGSGGGLTAAGNQLWHQNQPGIQGGVETFDSFGAALAAGDFNGDGRADLAVGVPGEAIGTVEGAGAVSVLYGSGGGLTATGNQIWHQDQPGIQDAVEFGDNFASALATGDFNGDGYADLAIGVSEEDIGAVLNAGAVSVLYGSGGGLTATGNQFWHQNQPGIEDAVESHDFFGRALAAGDLNGDGRADLAVGVPLEDIGTVVNAGAVSVLYGSGGGLTAAGNQFWHQDQPGIQDAIEPGDVFGSALAAGDLNGDGRADLAVSVPNEAIGAVANAGAVNVLYGSGGGLTATGNQIWHQNQPGIQGAAELSDFFGNALAAGDLNGDGRADLAVGVRAEDIGTVENAGAVSVLYGSGGGLTAAGNQLWHQDQPGIEGVAETADGFGRALAIGQCTGAPSHRVFVPLSLLNAP